MKRYRIQTSQGYNGCEPITVYWVQVNNGGTWGAKWTNIKGFEDPRKADELLETLEE